ncbi:RNA methyltransferase [Muriicola sp. SD30]|uniref:RNA methyltransferase n=1 Tax=Muriicola sp. SD30 TaxID=3240936 RepID=UPI00351090A3
MKRKLLNKELNRLDVKAFKDAPKTPLILVLENIRSLHNIGSVFRTADAFLLEKIYLCGITATPPHKDIRKTALGATESVTWEYEKDSLSLINRIKKTHHCMAVEQAEGAERLDTFIPLPDKPYVFVFGNEVKGVSQEVVNACDGVLEIPQLGTKHSLNIAVSAGVVVWDFWTKLNRQKKMF